MGKNTRLAVMLAFFTLAVAGRLAGQHWETGGIQGQDVKDIALNSSAPDTVFAIAGVKVWKSSDGGATFTPVYAHPTDRDFTAIEVAPSDPMTVIVGDEGNAGGNLGKYFFTTDGGRNWTESSQALDGKINAISIDPIDNAVAFFATSQGLFRLIVEKDTLDCNTVIYDPTDDAVVYEGLKQGNGVGKTTDGGNTWTYYTNGFPAVSFSILDLAVNPLNNQQIFATASWTELATAVVYETFVSADGGVNWTPMGWEELIQTQDLGIDPTQGYLFVGHTGGVTIHSLGSGAFQSITGDLPTGQIRALAIAQGNRILAATNQGVYFLDYYPNLSAATKGVVESSGNQDGIPDPGETIDLSIGLVNSLFDGADISATLSVINDPTVTVTKGSANYPDILANSYGDNSADPYTIEIDAAAGTHVVDFELEITANGGAFTGTDTVSLMIGAPTILLVDDDGGAPYDTFYTNALDSLVVPHDVWNTFMMGQLTNQLDLPYFYKAVVWMSGDQVDDILTPEDIALLTDYLGNGGRLILTGQNIVQDLDNGGNPDPFLTDVLHIGLAGSSATGRLLFGVDGDILGDQIEKCLISGGGGGNNQTSPDYFTILPDSLAKKFLTYVTPSGAVGAVHVEDEATASQAIVLGFGFEAVNRSNPSDTTTITRAELMSLMLDFVQPGVGIGDGDYSGGAGLPKAFALGQNYPNPFNPSTTIDFTVPGGNSEKQLVTLKVFNLRGQMVRSLVDEGRISGAYRIQWDGRADNGVKAASGIYVYQLTVGDQTTSRKMVLLK